MYVEIQNKTACMTIFFRIRVQQNSGVFGDNFSNFSMKTCCEYSLGTSRQGASNKYRVFSDFFTCASRVPYSHFCFGTHILNLSEFQDSQSYSGKFCNGRNDFL